MRQIAVMKKNVEMSIGIVQGQHFSGSERQAKRIGRERWAGVRAGALGGSVGLE